MNSVFGDSVERWRAAWTDASATQFELQLFALVDPAQDKRIIQMIASGPAANECLFGYDLDSPIALKTPRLLSLNGLESSRLQTWIVSAMGERPIATLIASTLNLPALAAHFRQCIDVELEGFDSMFLALWDPAILGALLGQRDDKTLHVSGPVLKPAQIHQLVWPLSHWWYVDRDGGLHNAISSEWQAHDHQVTSTRLVLDAKQVDLLVESSVPDHLLQHIRENQPELLERLPANQHYRFAQQQLRRARDYGLEGTGDLVNYLCLALAFGSTFDQLPPVAVLLAQVRDGASTFDEALLKMPEGELTSGMKVPVLL